MRYFPALALAFLSAVSCAAQASDATHGPLLARGPGAPEGVCTAFQVAAAKGPRLVTARHCLHDARPRAWLPGLEGSAIHPGQSQWSVLRSIPARPWASWPGAPHGADLAWAAGWPDSPVLLPGPMPVVGQSLRIAGYPQGRGPKAWACVFAGMVVLEGAPPRIRPSLRCSGNLPANLHGMSGGPVLDAQGRVVGVLVSGTRVAGRLLPGFEPLADGWLPEGESAHPLLTDSGPARHRLQVRMDRRELSGYRVLSPQGVAWSWWPAATARHRLAPPLQP